MLLAGITAGAVQARGAEVLMVLTSEAGPYRQTQAGLQKRLTALGHTSRAVSLKSFIKSQKADPKNKPDALVAVGTGAATWFRKNFKGPTPVAYCMVGDPVGAGLCGADGMPGVTTDVPVKAQFKLIAEALPKARTIGMVYSSRSTACKRLLREARASLPKGWSLEAIPAEKYETPAKAFGALLAKPIDVVWTTPEPGLYTRLTVRTLLLGAIRKRKPVFGFSLGFVKAGALLGTGIDPRTQGHQAADLIAKLIRARTAGTGSASGRRQDASAEKISGDAPRKAPADRQFVPVAPKHQIGVNLIVADNLSVSLPRELVKRAALVVKPKGR